MPVMKNKKLSKTTGKQYDGKESIVGTISISLIEKWLPIVSIAISVLGIIGTVWVFSYQLGKIEQEFRDKIEFNQKSIVEIKVDLKEFKKEHKEDLKEITHSDKIK